MFDKRKVHSIFSILLFILLCYITISCLIDGITLNWVDNNKLDGTLINNITLFTWLVLGWGVFTIGLIIANFYTNNKLKWVKFICLIVLTILFIVLACLMASKHDMDLENQTIVIATFSNFIVGTITMFAYSIVTLIDNILSMKRKGIDQNEKK